MGIHKGTKLKIPGLKTQQCDKVRETVEDIFKLDKYQILTDDKTHKVCDARHLFAWIMYRKLNLRLIDVARYLNRNHATIYKSVEKHEFLYGHYSDHQHKTDIVLDILGL